MSEEKREPFEITDDRQAEYAVRKIVEAREDTARWKDYYAGAMAKIEKANEDTEAYFTALLERYFATVPHRKSRTQESYALPSAKLVYKQMPPEYRKSDPAALLQYAKAACPEEVREEVYWAGIKRRIAAVTEQGEAIDGETGEVIPGIAVLPQGPAFRVSLKKEGENERV